MVTGRIKQYNKENLENLASTVVVHGYTKIGISYNEKDSFFADNNARTYPNFIFSIGENIQNKKDIQVGKSDIYELTQPIYIENIFFPIGYPDSIKLDILYCDKEEEE